MHSDPRCPPSACNGRDPDLTQIHMRHCQQPLGSEIAAVAESRPLCCDSSTFAGSCIAFNVGAARALRKENAIADSAYNRS